MDTLNIFSYNSCNSSNLKINTRKTYKVHTKDFFFSCQPADSSSKFKNHPSISLYADLLLIVTIKRLKHKTITILGFILKRGNKRKKRGTRRNLWSRDQRVSRMPNTFPFYRAIKREKSALAPSFNDQPRGT